MRSWHLAPVIRAAAVLLVVLGLCSNGVAYALDRPQGPVMLTITGSIENTNRAGFDELEDGMFKYHERTFENAAAFDLAMLEALGAVAVTINYSKWPAPVRLEGPRLSSLLDAVGAKSRAIVATALDGFAVELSPETLSGHDWIVAIKRNGTYLGVGDRGPVWLVYAPHDGVATSDDDEAQWPWAVFTIEVK